MLVPGRGERFSALCFSVDPDVRDAQIRPKAKPGRAPGSCNNRILLRPGYRFLFDKKWDLSRVPVAVECHKAKIVPFRMGSLITFQAGVPGVSNSVGWILSPDTGTE